MSEDKDKALAKQIVGNEGRATYNFYALMDRVESALATVRREAREEALKESKADYDYAVRLATVMWRYFYPDNEEWQPLATLNGVLSQIDNMIAGLVKPQRKSFRIQEPTGPF